MAKTVSINEKSQLNVISKIRNNLIKEKFWHAKHEQNEQKPPMHELNTKNIPISWCLQKNLKCSAWLDG